MSPLRLRTEADIYCIHCIPSVLYLVYIIGAADDAPKAVSERFWSTLSIKYQFYNCRYQHHNFELVTDAALYSKSEFRVVPLS